MAEYLLFATERYALPILAPLAQALQASGQSVSAWFEDGARGLQVPGVREIGLRQALASSLNAFIIAKPPDPHR